MRRKRKVFDIWYFIGLCPNGVSSSAVPGLDSIATNFLERAFRPSYRQSINILPNLYRDPTKLTFATNWAEPATRTLACLGNILEYYWKALKKLLQSKNRNKAQSQPEYHLIMIASELVIIRNHSSQRPKPIKNGNLKNSIPARLTIENTMRYNSQKSIIKSQNFHLICEA